MIEMILALVVGATTPEPTACEGDPVAVMKVDFQTFDQDWAKGWRSLIGPGCKAIAPSVIEAYRSNLQQQVYILFWHEGQLRAELGEVEEAIALFERSKKPPMTRFKASFETWNDYVDASIAFLKKDRKALLDARVRLASAKPGQDIPQNRPIVDAFVACFDLTYVEAYSSPACRTKGQALPPPAFSK